MYILEESQQRIKLNKTMYWDLTLPYYSQGSLLWFSTDGLHDSKILSIDWVAYIR